MSDHASDDCSPDLDSVRHARRFISRHEGRPDIHGVQFPSGRVLADHPDRGLLAAIEPQYVADDPTPATVIWAPEPSFEGVGESKSPD